MALRRRLYTGLFEVDFICWFLACMCSAGADQALCGSGEGLLYTYLGRML